MSWFPMSARMEKLTDKVTSLERQLKWMAEDNFRINEQLSALHRYLDVMYEKPHMCQGKYHSLKRGEKHE